MNTRNLIIKHDDCAESPRDWDNLGTLYAPHRTYRLSDKHANDIRDDDGNIPDCYLYLNVYMYEHGGIALNTSGFSCPWDSGQLGIIYVKKSDVLHNWNRQRMSKKLEQQIYECLEAEVNTLSQYLNGEVFGYEYQEVTESGEVIQEDSCWGFFGSDLETNGIADQLPVKLSDCQVIYQ